MKFLYTFLGFCLLIFSVEAQITFPIKIQDFSDRYYAVIEESEVLESERSSEDITPYSIKVYDKNSNQLFIHAQSSGFPDYLINENKEAIPNIQELPYGSQSVLLYEDYNFDGIADLALMNGYNSCYGGPSFDIYLAHNNSFVFSEGFSVLSNEYCGMFQVDYDRKIISTMTKSGCCWHEFSEFKVVNNEPSTLKVVVRDASGGMQPFLLKVTTSEWVGDKKTFKELLLPPYEGLDIVYSFELDKSKRKVILFMEHDVLYYALQLPDESIEFYYPQPYYDEEKKETVYGRFTFSEKNGMLIFRNKDATYEIYENGNAVGIKVITKGKTHNMKGVFNDKNSALKEVFNYNKILNITYE